MFRATLMFSLAPGVFAVADFSRADRCTNPSWNEAENYPVIDTQQMAGQSSSSNGWCCSGPTNANPYADGCCKHSDECRGTVSCTDLPPLPAHADVAAMTADCVGLSSKQQCALKCLPGYVPKSDPRLPHAYGHPKQRPTGDGSSLLYPLYTCSNGNWVNLVMEGGLLNYAYPNSHFTSPTTPIGNGQEISFDYSVIGHYCEAAVHPYMRTSVDLWDYVMGWPCCRNPDGGQNFADHGYAWTFGEDPYDPTHYNRWPAVCPAGYEAIQTKDECESAGNWVKDNWDTLLWGSGALPNYPDLGGPALWNQGFVDVPQLADTGGSNPGYAVGCNAKQGIGTFWNAPCPHPRSALPLTDNSGRTDTVCQWAHNPSAWYALQTIMGTPMMCKKSPGPPVDCVDDHSELACGTFEGDTDFTLANDGPGHALFTNTLPINAGTLVIGNGPWERTNTVAQQTSSGCMFTQAQTVGAPTATVYPDATTVPPADLTCDVTQTTACSPTGSGAAAMSLKYSMAELVSHLDDAGRFAIYYHRITANPILGSGVGLLWIAQNACKIYVDVEFQCTGGNCVEVTTIVCASFAGIDTSDHGKLKIECKVPPGFDIATMPNPTGAAPHQAATLTVAENPATLFTGVTPSKNFANGAASWEYTSPNPIAAAGSAAVVVGSVTVRGSVTDGNIQTGSGSGGWTVVEDIYVAKYNLSLASATIDPLTMPVAIFFYSDPTSAGLADLSSAFPSSLATMPFLSKQNVEYGQITSNVNAFVRVIAKVTAASHWFKDLRVTKVEKDAQGAGYADHQTLLESCYQGNNVANGADILEAVSTWTTDGNSYPLATIRCTEFIADSPSDTTPNVAAGDTVRLTLKWKLRKVATTSGKAQLLQDAATSDPADQSVEVKLAISIGAATTDIQVADADAAASKSVRSTTYIIIAVCVVAAGLLVAGLVVAYLCLRNRGADVQEMASPAKYSVAAVYDVSAPKEVMQDV